ncbi:carboxymuconolactone decarboxylase family protein [Spiribacter halobius]|uniref:Peroxidase n=1 Tax=Sediminicurvatus halobius TaxID=2182432 RepID=A0A2U2N5J0_9GAMM|nr:peroxidase [Spiribacter halobius]PWG64362.1 peroxidase [Spiribacter halobius]UEX79290.1 hypothetical protein LMH63_06535 [Spiribacter halobius]
MCYIATTTPADARDDVRRMYLRQQARFGYVPNYAKPFCHRPGVMDLWRALLAGIRQPMDPYRFELATFAAAQALGSSYCSLAHGCALLRWLPADVLQALAAGDTTGLSPVDAAVFRFAWKVASDAPRVTEDDIEALRAQGLTDAEIFDVAATAAARCFFANLVEGLGARADADFRSLDPALRERLTLGRPLDEAPARRVPARPSEMIPSTA